MGKPLLELLEPGLGVSFQDEGRTGWKKFGVPPGGAMDRHAAEWANRLVGNGSGSPVLEILLGGARFRALDRVEMALTGAAGSGSDGKWSTRTLATGDCFGIPHPGAGVWSYLAVRGGFEAPRWFGSTSVFARGGLGEALQSGARLFGADASGFRGSIPGGMRWVIESERRLYLDVPVARVWRGPDWSKFADAVREVFFGTGWCLSSRSDRTGYRLEGPRLSVAVPSMASEPVLPGSIQIPPDGQPIVTMYDGPTVGGYPKLGLVDPKDLSRIAQCQPGREVRFRLVDDHPAKTSSQASKKA